MQRLYAQSMSPLVSHIEESLAGGATIRAFNAEARFRQRLSALNDDAADSFVSFVAVRQRPMYYHYHDEYYDADYY